ncbi:interleukin-12 subunit beta-like [Emydura macquarii macquarii]|uniref:interleukin-12 subunit beta-like n=1 Tax=Emydura macquarii macquarii TaxID=1129001 RepID=UPI00352B1419
MASAPLPARRPDTTVPTPPSSRQWAADTGHLALCPPLHFPPGCPLPAGYPAPLNLFKAPHWPPSSPSDAKPMLALVVLVQVLCMVPVAALTGFPGKFLVGDVNGQVVVTCDAAEEHVSWKLNGDSQIMAEHHLVGRSLTLEGLDLPAAGNYSCWNGTHLLDSTYLVISDPLYPLLLGAPGHAVSCQVESYHGELTCSWTALHPAAFRARLSRSPDAPGDWLYVDRGAALQDAAWPQLFTVTLADRSFCPFAEEQSPLELALEGISAESFVNITRRLFLQDIVRPAPPQDVAMHSKGGALHLSWAPPASWSSPHSYFLLRYQLRCQHSDGTMSFHQLEGETETLLKVDVRRVQIRCQDPFVNSTWSPWTAWQNV